MAQCRYCSREATLLCDFVVSLNPYQTCNCPLCEDHAHTVGGPIFFSGEDGWIDSRDLCPGHKDFPGGFRPDWDGPVGGDRGRRAVA